MVKYTKKRQSCPKCSVTYSKREYLSKHMMKQHNIILEKRPPGRFSQYIVDKDDPRPYKCDQCIKSYIKSKHLNRHRRTHFETKQCDVCNEIFTNYADHMLKKHGIELPRPFECDICHRTYRTKKHIKSHMRIHRGDSEAIDCTVCMKTFSCSANLRKHMKTHSQDRPVICDICGEAFKSSNTLVCHMRRHTGERPFQCSQCQRAFISRNSLEIHYRTHTGEKPFQCEFCSKGFSDKSTLHVHKRLHTNENPYMCHLCGRRTKQASNLRSHYKHFHKNNDISGRQIRLNSRIFSRFSQSEIDTELQKMGDLMALLARGMGEFDREEKEKKNQMKKALQVISRPAVEQQTKENTLKLEDINPADIVEAKLREENHDSKSTTIRTKNVALNQKSKRQIKPSPWSTIAMTVSNRTNYSQNVNENDSKIIELEIQPIYNSIKKDRLEIESVFIEDASYPQPDIEDYSNECIEKHESNIYPFDNFDAAQPFEIIKAESLAPESSNIVPIINIQKRNVITASPTVDMDDLSSITNASEQIKIEDQQSPAIGTTRRTSKRKKTVASKVMDIVSTENTSKRIDSETSQSMDMISTANLSKRVKLEPMESLDIVSMTNTLKRHPTKINQVNNVKIKHNDEENVLEQSQNVEEPPQSIPKNQVYSPKTKVERCLTCNRKFHDMTKHWLELHSGIDRPFECLVCHRIYKKFEHLKYHMKIHCDERNYVCHVCGEAFVLANELRKHIMYRHQVERPFKCTFQQCKKCFKDQHGLNIHSRTHSGIKPYVCIICNEAFAALSSLRIHERKHTGEKPYICKFCNKAFADCSTHKQHVRIHTGDKPYKCHLCDRRTAQAGNLKSHYRHYHKIIVKSVSMFVNNNSAAPFANEFKQNPNAP